MPNYVTSADMDVWCEKTIEEAPPSSLKTAAEHLLVLSRNAQRALEVERSVTAELRAEAHQLRVNLHLERDRVAALESRLAEEKALRERGFADEAEVHAALGAAGVPLGEKPPDGAVGTRLYSTAQRVVMLAHERDMARAEVEMLRGVGCEEQKEGEPQSGRCGACIKCAQAERDEARQLGAQHHLPGMSAELDAVRWERDTALTRAHRIEAAAREAADLLGVVASEVEGDAASVYGQVRWARDARRVEASIRAALEGGG